MITKKDVFESVIAEKIEPLPKPADIANEYENLKKHYGQFLTLELYAVKKGISKPTLSKYLREYRASK